MQKKHAIALKVVTFLSIIASSLVAGVDSIESREEFREKLGKYALSCMLFYQDNEQSRKNLDIFEDAEHEEDKRNDGLVYFMKLNTDRTQLGKIGSQYGATRQNVIVFFKYGKEQARINLKGSEELYQSDIIDKIDKIFGKEIEEEQERRIRKYRLAKEKAEAEAASRPWYGYPSYYYGYPYYGYPYYYRYPYYYGYPYSGFGFSIGLGGRSYRRGHHRRHHR